MSDMGNNTGGNGPQNPPPSSDLDSPDMVPVLSDQFLIRLSFRTLIV